MQNFAFFAYTTSRTLSSSGVVQSSVGIDFSAAHALPSLRWNTSDPVAGHLISAVRGSGRAIFILSGTKSQPRIFFESSQSRFSVRHFAAKLVWSFLISLSDPIQKNKETSRGHTEKKLGIASGDLGFFPLAMQPRKRLTYEVLALSHEGCRHLLRSAWGPTGGHEVLWKGVLGEN